MSNRRQPFTPQRSPSQPASEASPTLSSSEGRVDDDGLGGGANRIGGGGEKFTTYKQTATSPLRGWTAHQSHGQATVLFYVPRWTRESDLDIRIGERYVIAGIEGQTPIIKASLAGLVDVRTSAWQLEKRKVERQSQRRRKHSRTRTSSAEHSSGSQGSVSERQKTRVRLRHGTQSPSQQSDISDFDLLARSTDTFGSSGVGSHSKPQPRISNRPSGSGSTDADPISYSPSISSPASLSQSMTLSETGTGEYVASIDAASRSVSSGDVRSLGSSSGNGRRLEEEEEEDEVIRDAKLVTLHLEKIDGGIWPCIVAGPAPLNTIGNQQQKEIDGLIHSAPRDSLDAAIREALSRSGSRSHSRTFSLTSEEGSEGNHGFKTNESTVTVDTIASDDDTTVLGVRTTQRDEDRYNMDPVSLTLLGLQYAAGHVARGGGGGGGKAVSGSNVKDELFGFECLRRAWKEAEMPAAIIYLVENFLPLRPSPLHALAPYRQRLIAALGGMSALARLYVSYAHLQIPLYDHEKPLLSLPMSGTSNNPFGAPGQHQRASSPRSSGGNAGPTTTTNVETDEDLIPGPLQFLEEAHRCDPSLPIRQCDWLEARTIEEVRPVSQSWSRAMSATSDEKGVRSHQSSVTGGKKRRSSKRDKRVRGGSSDPKTDSGSLLFLVVSRAALLSVVVAGGVAMAGWWRRAAAAAGGGGGTAT